MAQASELTATKIRTPARGKSINRLFDNLFFILGGVSAVWLAWIVFTESFSLGWWQILYFVLFWVILAYLALPRLHRILTQLYVPNYFIGRARTSDGLLGDPINLALLGSELQLNTAMREAGWVRADAITFRSTWRIIASTVLRRSYDEAPVSPLLLFDRQQDVAYQQEVLGNPAKRHHVRFWRCPDGWLLPGGHRVDWLAAGTFDRSVGFSLFTLQITHKIDHDTDIERDHIVDTLTTADAAISVEILRDFSTGYHSRNGGGDTIKTDGDLPVLDLRAVHTAAGTQPSTQPSVVPSADEIELLVAEERAQRRPAPTILGSLLMLARVLAGAYFVASTALGAAQFIRIELRDAGVGAPTGDEIAAGQLVLNVLLAIFAAALLFYLVLAFLVYSGRNWARITAMVMSALAVVSAGIDYFNGGTEVILLANLFGLPLDILVLLALSSQDARIYARRIRQSGSGRRRIAPPVLEGRN
ncbi:MAG: LssY C-terminal domain-containing protein [Microbacteriaceae bacterium]